MIMSSGISPNNPRNVTPTTSSNNISGNNNHIVWHHSLNRKPPPQSRPPTPNGNRSSQVNANHQSRLQSQTLKKTNISRYNSNYAQSSSVNSGKPPGFQARNKSSLGLNRQINDDEPSLARINNVYGSKVSNGENNVPVNNCKLNRYARQDIYEPASIASPDEYRKRHTMFRGNSNSFFKSKDSKKDCLTTEVEWTDRQSLRSNKNGRSSSLGGLIEKFGTLRRKVSSSYSQSSKGGTIRNGKQEKPKLHEKDNLPEAEKIYAEGLQALNGNEAKRKLRLSQDLEDMVEGETKTIIDQVSQQNHLFKLLESTLVNWINDELAQERMIISDLQEDLSDGQVICKLFEKLQNVRLDTIEVTQNETVQKSRLLLVLNQINNIFNAHAKWITIRWSLQGIHGKNLVEIIYLLVAMALFYQAPIRLPQNVNVRIVIVQKFNNQLIKKNQDIQLTDQVDSSKDRVPVEQSQRDVFDTLVEFAPEKLAIVEGTLVRFVNEHLNKVNIDLSSSDNILIPERFSDGILLVLLISSLENYFVPFGNLFTSDEIPANVETRIKTSSYTNTQPIQKLHNVNLAFDLIKEANIKISHRVKPEHIVNGDLKAVLRVLYAIFQQYKKR